MNEVSANDNDNDHDHDVEDVGQETRGWTVVVWTRKHDEEPDKEKKKETTKETGTYGIQEYRKVEQGGHRNTYGEQNESRIAAKKYRRSTEKIRILAVTTGMDERDRESAAREPERKKSWGTKGEGRKSPNEEKE